MTEAKIHQPDVQIAIVTAVGNLLAGFKPSMDKTLADRVKAVTQAFCEGLTEGVNRALAKGGQQ